MRRPPPRATPPVTHRPDIALTMPARAENVPLVRRVVAGVAEVFAFDEALVADMNIALTEACTNVVVHAYGDGGGPLGLAVCPAADGVIAVVRDLGGGIAPRPTDPDDEALGVGLTLMTALASPCEIRSDPGDGTEVRLTFGPAGAHPGETATAPPCAGVSQGALRAVDGAVTIDILPGPLLEPVLARVFAMMAARSRFSLDRLGDAQLVSDALSTRLAQHLDGTHANIEIQERPDGLELRLGRLAHGGAEGLLNESTVPGMGRVVERLADEVVVEPAGIDGHGPAERLRVRLAERPGAGEAGTPVP